MSDTTFSYEKIIKKFQLPKHDLSVIRSLIGFNNHTKEEVIARFMKKAENLEKERERLLQSMNAAANTIKFLQHAREEDIEEIIQK